MASRLGLFLSMAAAAVALAACGGGGPSPLTLTPLASPTARPLASPAATPATPRASPSPTLLTPTPSPTAPATPTVGTTGSPFSFADLQKAWVAKGIQATLGERSGDFRGFAASAYAVRATRGGDSLDLAVLVYKDSQAVKEDWELAPGQAPKAKEGRSFPPSLSVWWNENIIVAVRARVGEIGADAFEAFLSLGGPPASPTPTPVRPTAPSPTPAR